MSTTTLPRQSAGLIAGKPAVWRHAAKSYQATEAATGALLPGHFFEAEDEQIDAAAEAAREAFRILRQTSAAQRAGLLEQVATGMRARQAEILERCGQETGYLPARVAGEFERAVSQLHLFARLAERSVWDRRQIDPADPDRQPLPRPEMRRRLVPIGPVAVFGACNFPLAISVLGNDFVAAIAVGCPVIVKSHPGHPGTCELLGQVAAQAVAASGLPPGTFSLLHGRQPETSLRLVQHPHIAAVGFTGSPGGGRALAEAVLRRRYPIPMFAELGSTNPVFIAPQAATANAASVAAGFVASLRFGNGQMCTKPGVLVVREDRSEALQVAAIEAMRRAEPLPLLNADVTTAFDAGVRQLLQHPGVDALHFDDPRNPSTWHRGPHWFSVTADRAIADDLLHQETFGPVSLLVRCRDDEQMLEVAKHFHGSLTTTLHTAAGDEPFGQRWLPIAEGFAGRILFNGWPTGMEIGPATQHGGPYPASLDSRSTSVGYASLERFVRPVCYQNWPPKPLQATGDWSHADRPVSP